MPDYISKLVCYLYPYQILSFDLTRIHNYLLQLNLLDFILCDSFLRVISSVGRASPLQGEGRQFEPVITHQPSPLATVGEPVQNIFKDILFKILISL
jgi:hypothetical protein